MVKVSSYQPEIDGLRAVAILSVLIFHAFPSCLPGGFLGVDIFFVISGYLIGRQVIADLEARSFSFSDFYARRIRRLLPALFIVYLVTVAIGALLLPPSEFSALTLAMRASALIASNFHFANRTGYFDENASVSPLLHTWSLSIEEQFYLVFPVLLWGISRRRFDWAGWLLIILVLFSLAVAFNGFHQDSRRAFFFPHTRAWELLCGVIIARYAPLAGFRSLTLAILSFLSLGVICLAFFIQINAASKEFINVLLAVCGASMIIIETFKHSALSTQQFHPVSALFSCRPFVFVGGLSYPLYLWHWPLLVYVRQVSDSETNAYLIAGVCILAFVLAEATRRFVEAPFRVQLKLSPRGAYVSLGAALVLLIGISLVSETTKGLPQRFSPELRSIFASLNEWRSSPRFACMHLPPSADIVSLGVTGSPCRFGVADKSLDLILWGDSHSASFQPGFDRWSKQHGLAGVAVTSQCRPVAISPFDQEQMVDCAPMRHQILDAFFNSDAQTLVLAMRWNQLVEGQMPTERRFKALKDSERGYKASLLEGELRNIAKIVSGHGKRLVIVYSVPEISFHVPDKVGSRLSLGLPEPRGPLLVEVLDRRGRTAEALDRAVAGQGVAIVDPLPTFCKDRCEVVRDGKPLYFDNHYISIHTIDMVADMLEASLAASLPLSE